MTQVTLPGTDGSVTFRYDPFGRRIYKASLGGTSIFAYDGANIVEEVDAAGTLVARYTQGPSIDEPMAMLRGANTSYYQQDGLGTVTSLSGVSGSLAQTYVFDSFGQQTASSGSLTNPFRYTGREFDPETGLYYYRARYYDQTTGRFVSEDPLGLTAGTNFYKYADNDPVVFKDPTGKDMYVCTAPLHALGDLRGNLAYYTLPFVGIPTHHEFLCVWDGKKMVCGGQDRTGGALAGAPGQPSNDTAMERGGGCSDVNDQQCVDQCVTKAIKDPNRPNYDLVNGWPNRNKGRNCQKWADDTLQRCVQQCVGKK